MLAPLESKAIEDANADPVTVIDHHVCLIYDDPTELARLAGPVLLDFDASTTRLVLVSNAANFPGAGGAEVTDADSQIIPAEALGMCDMPISVHHILDRLSDRVRSNCTAGFETLLFLDMTWLLDTPSGIANHGEFEVALHRRLAMIPARVVCLYNRHYFPEMMLLDALRTHPYVCTAEGFMPNPHYLPPAAFLRGDVKVQLDAWLQTLGPAVGAGAVDPRGADRALLHVPAISESEFAVPWPVSSHPTREARALPKEANPAARRWKIRCMGGLRIYREDGTPVCWGQVHGATIKTKTVFAVLLSRGAQGAAAEELADLLWPDARSTEQGLNRLYHTIHCLRGALEPDGTSTLLECRDHRYYLTLPEGTWTDVPLFEQLCRRGEEQLRAGALDSALAFHQSAERLYAGPLFADIPLKYVDNTEHDWCWSRRYWLEQVYVKMLTYSASIHHRLGDHLQAVVQAEKALKLSPCLESAHCEIMRAFHKLGRRDAFERQFRLCRDALRRFEDRAPSSETRVLYNNLTFK